MKTSPFAHPLLRRLAVLAAVFLLPAAWAQDAMVRLRTTQGLIDISLLNTQAPLTTANFLAYARAGDFTDVMFHRSAWVQIPSPSPFVIQGGGYVWTATGGCCTSVVSRGAVPNEFSASRSNIRGTVAMAKLGNDPNSATSQWFINMMDNAANLDTQNGGFTVFGRVTTQGMATADRIAALTRVNAGSVFTELPVADWTSGPVTRSNVVLVTGVTELANGTESDRVFNYLEARFPSFLSPDGTAGSVAGYTFRYYSGTNAYLATKDGKVWFLAPAISGNTLHDLGATATWLANAQAAGY